MPFFGTCGGDDGGADDDDDGDGGGGPPDACEGLGCNQVDCPTAGETTSLSGVVYAPNGTLPLYGINVYVPNVPLGPPAPGAVCDRCTYTLAGYPLSLVQTDEAGHFVMNDVPAGINVLCWIASANRTSPTSAWRSGSRGTAS